MYQNSQAPWGNWYGQPPPPNTIFVPMKEPKRKKNRRLSLKTIGDQIKMLEELKKQLEGDKKSKDGSKPGEFNWDKFLKTYGTLCFFGPPVGLMYYEFFKYITH